MKDLQRTRHSCGRMIRLLALALPPSSVSKLSFFLSLPVLPVELTDRRGGKGVGEEPNHYREKAWSAINHSIFSDRKSSLCRTSHVRGGCFMYTLKWTVLYREETN